MQRGRSFFLVGAVLAAAIGPITAAGAADTGTGTVTATVTVADDAPCLTLSATTLTVLPLSLEAEPLPFSTAGVRSEGTTGSYDVTNCGSVAVSLLVRSSTATGTTALWTPVDTDFSTTCETPDVFLVDAEGGDGIGTFPLLVSDKDAGNLAAGTTGTVSSDLIMPCVGSSGADKTVTFDIIWTAVAPA